jgi:hypothetical protein
MLKILKYLETSMPMDEVKRYNSVNTFMPFECVQKMQFYEGLDAF